MSEPAILDLEIYRGDDYAHKLTFVDDASPPGIWDLSTMSFKAQIRDRPEYGTVVYATFEIDDRDASLGVLVLHLSADATRIPPGYWDLEIVNGTKQTMLKGAVTMSGDVTQEVNL